MATTLTNMNETTIVAAMVSALKYGLVPIDAFTLKAEVNGRVQNDIVRVPVVTVDPTAQSKTPGTGLTSNGTIAATSVTLSNLYEAKWQLNEAQIAGGNATRAFAALAAGASYSIAKQVIDAAFGLILKASTGDTDNDKVVVAPGDFGQGDIGNILTKAANKKIGPERTLILNASYAGNLIGESSLGLILATTGDAAIKTGVLPPLMGMNTLMYAGLPTNSENLGGFCGGKSCVAAAIAPPELLVSSGEGNLITAETITNPEGNIAAVYKRWYDADAGTVYGSLAVLYGVAFLQNSVIRVVSE